MILSRFLVKCTEQELVYNGDQPDSREEHGYIGTSDVYQQAAGEQHR
jgi:hypothetical protein